MNLEMIVKTRSCTKNGRALEYNQMNLEMIECLQLLLNGEALEFTSDEFKNDREILLLMTTLYTQHASMK